MAKITYKDHDIYEMHIRSVNKHNDSILVDEIKDISVAPSEAQLDANGEIIILTDGVAMIDSNEKPIVFKDLKPGDNLKVEFKTPVAMLLSMPGQIGSSSIIRLIKQ